jgi:hypothetical protein
MSEPLMRLKQLRKTNRYTLLEKIKMSYHLIKCYYYDMRSCKTRNIFTQRKYDSCYLNEWVKYKLIYYKPE